MNYDLDLEENEDSVQGLKIYDETGNIITTYDDDAGWLESGVEQNEFGEWIMTYIYHPYSKEELEQIQIEKDKEQLEESRQQMDLEEVVALFIRSQLNNINIPEQISLRMLDYYPTFKELIGQTVNIGYRFVHEGKMYKTIQDQLTIQSQYVPGIGTESLYARIDIEHTGAIYDPIPYDGNMELHNGKYYIQNNITYLCNRDSGNPLVHALKDLVGLYVSIIKPIGSSQTEQSTTIPEFKQPTGAHDAYKLGDQVMYKGVKYESTIDNNTYAPDVYPQGWKEIK